MPLSAAMRERVAKAEKANNEDAHDVLITDAMRRDPKWRPSAEDIAYLSTPARNGEGQGYNWLANGEPRDADDAAAHRRWRRLAAEHGSGEAQAYIASDLLNGSNGATRDERAGREWLERAAHGGDAWAGRRLYFFARDEGDLASAERWLLGSVASENLESLLELTRLWIGGTPGLSGTKEQGLSMLKSLIEDTPAARRLYAELLVEGKSTPKDPAEARRLLARDAEQGDHASESLLGLHLLNGDFGSVDEREGTRWIERAVAGNEEDAINGYAFWLYYKKATPASRKQAVQVWRDAYARDIESVANNYAWALCTTTDEALRDGKTGSAVAATIPSPTFGEIDTVAACHAAAGDFAQAKATQQSAIDQFKVFLDRLAKARGGKPPSKDDQERYDAQQQELQARFALYAAGKDYRTDKQ
jgi:TPR repeat protein